MRILLQRVKKAAVEVGGEIVSAIGSGMLVFIGIEKGDTCAAADYLASKIANLRIYEDEAGKMNLSIQQINGAFLVVSQFTLAGDTSRGNRPGFEHAALPEEAKPLYEYFVARLSAIGLPVKTGIFQAEMQVTLQNDGPVTFILERRC